MLLYSCSTNGTNSEDIASSIEIKFSNSETFLIDDPIELFLVNKSSSCIVFPLVDGLRIYTQQNGKKVEIKNLINNMGSQDLILYPKGEILSTRSLDLRPDITGLKIDKPTDFSVILTGYLCENEAIQIQKEILVTITP